MQIIIGNNYTFSRKTKLNLIDNRLIINRIGSVTTVYLDKMDIEDLENSNDSTVYFYCKTDQKCVKNPDGKFITYDNHPFSNINAKNKFISLYVQLIKNIQN